MLEDKDAVISTLRACLMSTKEGVPVSHLQRDYKSLVGQPIPFQKCGFQSLESFLRSVSGIQISTDRSGNLMVEAVATESSAHMSSLISRQKKSGGRKKLSRPFAPSRKPTHSWKPLPSSSRYPPPRIPLSITLSNRNDNQGNVEKHLRKVTVSNTPTVHQYSPPTSPNQNHSNHPSILKDTSYKSKYEIPPRHKKSLPGLGNVPSVSEKPDFPAAEEGLKQPQLESVDAEALRKRLHSQLSLNNDNVEAVLEEYGYQAGVVLPPKLKTITSPFAPSQAVAAGRAKTDAEAVKDLQKNYGSYIQPLQGVVQPEFQHPSIYVQPTPSKGQLSRGYEPKTSPTPKSKDPAVNVYCEKLKAYSLKKGWPEPVYKILPRYPKNSRPLFGCQVKIGNDQQFASYPEESVYPVEAREFAAKKAFTKLEQMDREASLDTDKVTEDKALMCERVSKLVSPHSNGLWSYMVLDTYKKIYHETVPDDWLTILTSCPYVSTTRVSENKVIISPNQPSLENVIQYNNQMAMYNETKTPEVLYVPEITLPEENHWSVYITCVNSTTEVWARLIGDEYSTKYENMTTDMEIFYLNVTDNDSVGSPEVGHYYAAPFEDSWYRVCVQEIGDNKATCWLIDHGEFDDFPFTKLFKLEKKFFTLPRQVFQCQLVGLEDYGEEKIAFHLMVEMLLGKVFVSEVQERDLNAGVMSVVLYDTSTDDDINVNELLINRICVEGAKPQLPSEGAVKEVFISSVSDIGEVYLQVRSESYFLLEKLIHSLEPSVISANKITSFKDIVMNKLYLARFKDGIWYRALVVQPPSQQLNKIEVRYVDFGNIDTITISEIARLETISTVLLNLPYQAIKVQLHNVPLTSITPQKANRIRELLEDVVALVKVIVSGEIPSVEIFKRIMPDNALVSINSTIALDPTLNNQEEPRKRTTPNVGGGMKYVTDLSQGDGLPTRGLQPPQIPNNDNEYFNIFVPMVASPSNFTVQPLSHMVEFNNMTAEMQQYYARDTSILGQDDVYEGGVYAVLNTDRNWYRATVSSVISTNMASVHFCDFGDVTVVSLNDMKPLHQQFKKLPYLAIKAKLAGIAPSHSDWSVEDCIRFQSLICEKTLVSTVMETGPDLLNHAETVLGLKIIDTNTEDDIDIADLLVSEGRAIYVSDPPMPTI